jgi:hypothetical protein
MNQAVALGDSSSFTYFVQRIQNCSNITAHNRNGRAGEGMEVNPRPNITVSLNEVKAEIIFTH